MKNVPFYQFDSNPRFPPFLLHIRCKLRVTFVLRCFRDGNAHEKNNRFSYDATYLSYVWLFSDDYPYF